MSLQLWSKKFPDKRDLSPALEQGTICGKCKTIISDVRPEGIGEKLAEGHIAYECYCVNCRHSYHVKCWPFHHILCPYCAKYMS